jgi:hypothetical protein
MRAAFSARLAARSRQVRFVESSEALLVIRNFAYCDSSHFYLVESRDA